jgi:hypothetical protein
MDFEAQQGMDELAGLTFNKTSGRYGPGRGEYVF